MSADFAITSPSERAFNLANNSLRLADSLEEAHLHNMQTRVPSVIAPDGLIVPVVGTRTKGVYTTQLFDIILTRENEQQCRVSFAPAKEENRETTLVGKPIYNPDRITQDVLRNEAAARIGFTGLSCLVTVGEEGSSDFTLLGKDVETGEDVLLELAHGRDEVTTLVGALKRAAEKRLGEHTKQQDHTTSTMPTQARV